MKNTKSMADRKSPAAKGSGKINQPNYKGMNPKMSRGSSGTVAKNPGKR